jgi:NhaA family Na+:H+ antiporter
LAFNFSGETSDGWAIPTATDIALAIGLLALLGKRIPSSVRLFLLTLAIVDDILAVIIIAIFYSAGLNAQMLMLSGGIVIALVLLAKSKRLTLSIFVIAGIGLWLALNASGIHASISGAILGLLAPTVALKVNRKSISERLERSIIPVSTLFVVPLFAFANTGIQFSNEVFQSESFVKLSAGIFFGLVVGKVAGILIGTYITIKLGLSSLPDGATWNHIIGVGLLAGIGFTVSIFVTELAFQTEELIDISKISIFAASIVSGCLGLITLRFFNKTH